MKKILLNTFIIVFIFSILAEISARIIRSPALYKPDKNIGWVTKKNFRYNFKNYTQSNEKYFANVKTNKNGYLSFISDKKNTQNLIILGDSHVLGSTISNEDHWINIMHQSLKKNEISINIYGLGAGGYSTFQEFLLLKDAKKKVKIDYLILVFSKNDLINNNFFLEKENPHFIQNSLRPYQNKKNEIFFNETILSKILRSTLISNSYFFNFIFQKIALVNNNRKSKKNYFNYLVKKYNIESAKISNKILIQIQEEINIDKIFIFFPEYIEENIKKIILNNTEYLEFNLDSLRGNTKTIDIENFYHKDLGHFAPEGSKIIGNIISEEFKKNIENF